MLKQIMNIIQNYQISHFTGHIKLGIENNVINSMSITNRLDNSTMGNIKDYKEELKKVCIEYPEFYGSLDFNFSFGAVTAFVYNTTLKSDQLHKVLEDSGCRNVKLVVKK